MEPFQFSHAFIKKVSFLQFLSGGRTDLFSEGLPKSHTVCRRLAKSCFGMSTVLTSVLFTRGPRFSELVGDEAEAGMGRASVPQEGLSGLVVGLPASSSEYLLQMRRLKAAEHRLMLLKEFLGSHAQL